MTNLYSLAEQYKKFNEYIEGALDSGEELTEDDLQMYIDTLEAIEDNLEGKLENIGKFLKNIEGDIAAYKAEEQRLAKKRRYLEKKYDGLKEWSKFCLEQNRIDKMKAGSFQFSLRKSPASVNVIDATKIPMDYLIPQDPKINTKGLAQALKDGLFIEGAELINDKKYIVVS